ncbi:MAG: hypothetical protein WC280_02215 [Patescibacteria group bacterium]
MSLKRYLIIMTFLSLILWLAFSFIAVVIEPDTVNWIGMLFFYSSLFLALSGTFTLLGFFIRYSILKKGLSLHISKKSFRQSFLLSSLIVSVLFMLSQSLFSWLNVIIIILILSFLEYIFMSEK